MIFKIEQVALCPKDPERAIRLLTEMGMGEWVKDIVVARGTVGVRDIRPSGEALKDNVAHLAFNYQALGEAKELEVLHYSAGANWMDGQERVSHLGMHCTALELESWKHFFKRRSIGIAQEVDTLSHNNPAIAGKRWYHYCIFDTFDILGVDIKFIVRKDAP
jgi:hypothetical protein